MPALLFELAKLFPARPEMWDLQKPSKAVAAGIHAHVRRRFGTLQTASDKARVKEPTRLGIALRNYEPGDPLRALSRSHLIRSNELVTRTDFAAGRRSCGIVFHAYENMPFAAADSVANKGQIALAVSALVEAVYESLAQACVFRVARERDLGPVLSALGTSGSRPDELFVITDLLFLSSSREASARSLMEGIVSGGFSRACVFVVRDPLEHPSENKLSKRSAALRPFDAQDLSFDVLYSGEEYQRNLRHQLEHLRFEARRVGVDAHFVTGRTSLESVLNSVAEFVGGTL